MGVTNQKGWCMGITVQQVGGACIKLSASVSSSL